MPRRPLFIGNRSRLGREVEAGVETIATIRQLPANGYVIGKPLARPFSGL